MHTPRHDQMHRPTDDRPLSPSIFDHTNLKPDARQDDIKRLCDEAMEYGLGAVCVAPRWVLDNGRVLQPAKNKGVKICTVVGFPHGNTSTRSKRFQTEEAIRAGADEIDMVWSIGDLKDKAFDIVAYDIAEVVRSAHGLGAGVKVILETAFLDHSEIIAGCNIAAGAGADFVKTSTGFAPAGANADTVRLMRETVGARMGVKAAGGIRTLQDALAMIHAGADRLGCSNSIAILKEFRNSQP